MIKPSSQLTIGIELIDDPAWMGGTLYLKNLVICLSRLPVDERPKVRVVGAPNVVSHFLSQWGHLPIFDSTAEPLLKKVLRRVGWPEKSAAQIDVIYPGFGAQIPGAVTVRWVPDFQHRYLPHLFSADERMARDRSIGEIAEQPSVVVFSSEVAAEDYRRFYPNHRATPRVWHFHSLLDTSNPASHALIEKQSLPEKYLYLPNQFWAHKNHITVLKALARLRSEHSMVIPLVCTGAQMDRRNETHFADLLKFITAHDLTDQVHMLGLIDRHDQVDILRHAAAVVQPSLFEGWSTVVEDARATGRPIFLSDLPVHREQNLNRCTYFNPESDEHLASLVAAKWNTLRPGPDQYEEDKARQELDVRILESAQVFCDIARMALDIAKRTST